MKTHLMIDFETLGQTPSTVVLSLGAVLFDAEKIIEEREWVFNIEEQLRAKRDVKADTLTWWLKQGLEASAVFEKCQSTGVSLNVFLPEFIEWLKDKDIRIWGNGATFDVSIIEDLLNRMNMATPWKFWNVRCFRTLKTCFDFSQISHSGVKHNALDDARFQAQCVQSFLKSNSKADK